MNGGYPPQHHPLAHHPSPPHPQQQQHPRQQQAQQPLPYYTNSAPVPTPTPESKPVPVTSFVKMNGQRRIGSNRPKPEDLEEEKPGMTPERGGTESGEGDDDDDEDEDEDGPKDGKKVRFVHLYVLRARRGVADGFMRRAGAGQEEEDYHHLHRGQGQAAGHVLEAQKRVDEEGPFSLFLSPPSSNSSSFQSCRPSSSPSLLAPSASSSSPRKAASSSPSRPPSSKALPTRTRARRSSATR